MPKVLRIINRFNLGGPTYNAVYLTSLLSAGQNGETSFETKLIGGSPAQGEAHSGFIAEKEGVRFEEIDSMSRNIHFGNDIRTFFKIIGIIRKFKPDIVHTHAAKAGALGRLAAWLCCVPVIVHTYHGHVFHGYFGKFKSWVVRLIERMLGKITTHIICISELQFEEIIGRYKIVPIKKASVVALGFDLNRFSLFQEEKRNIFREKYALLPNQIAVGIIGRFAEIKNHALFLKAFVNAQQQNGNLRAFLIGDGALRPQLTALCDELGLIIGNHSTCHVTFTSWIMEIEDALAGLDIVVLTSYNEGTPVSLIEAQAAMRPVISTDVGGVRNCIIHDETGIIITQKVEDITHAMLKLAASESLRNQMGNAGRTFVLNKYSRERLATDMRALYNQLLPKA
jgi:glycosyltransferase involved in cell wall biosynthesis